MSTLRFGADGLIVAVIQDPATRRILMVGYLNEASLALTRQTGLVHFWSRSRREIWKKGETSGNTLEVVEIVADCDADALLITARPAGPTCHTGATSCFGTRLEADQSFATLESLWKTIAERIATRPPGSYTAQLAASGPDLTGRKLVEEATETLIAAKNHSNGGSGQRVIEEAADVLYHLLVLLAERGIEAGSVLTELQSRSR